MKLFKNSTLARLIACLVLGAATGVATGLAAQTMLGVLVGWAVACLLFVVWTFFTCWRMDGRDTATHAQREDASHGLSEIICLVASVASIAGIAVLLAGASADDEKAKLVNAVVAIGSVTASWLLVHTTYALRYARMYYDEDIDASIDFNEDDGYQPSYSDFYYVAFDMGTTYQISDTSVSGRTLRKHVMGQGMLGYVFGTVILAAAINVVVSLVG